MMRSNSSFFTSSPFTRAMTGGIVAGTGLGGAATGGAPDPPGAAGDVAAGALLLASVGGLRHAPRAAAARNTQTRTFDLTDTSGKTKKDEQSIVALGDFV
jgi:hypothetical protein